MFSSSEVPCLISVMLFLKMFLSETLFLMFVFVFGWVSLLCSLCKALEFHSISDLIENSTNGMK